MAVVPIGLDPALQRFLTDLNAAVQALQNPGQPLRDFAVLQAKLPPAESFKNGHCLVTDLNTMAISTPIAGVWTWTRADGSAL